MTTPDLGTDLGHVASATDAGSASKVSSKLENLTTLRLYRNAASSSSLINAPMVDGAKTLHPATTRIMPRMV